MKRPQFTFFGTPEFARIVLSELKNAGYIPSLIVTAPDKPVGRKHILTPPPVKVWGEENGIPVLQVSHPKEAIETLKEKKNDLFIVASYGYILSQEILDIPKYGVLNVHASLLPLYRGASPIESAILNGDEFTGSTIMKMVLKMDAGPILTQSLVPLNDEITKPELFEFLAHDGGRLLAETIEPYINGEITEQEQEESQTTYCKKIQKSDGDITRDDDTTRWRKYRAYYGWPGVFFFNEEGKRVKVTKARFENGQFIIERVIPEGKREMDYSSYVK